MASNENEIRLTFSVDTDDLSDFDSGIDRIKDGMKETNSILEDAERSSESYTEAFLREQQERVAAIEDELAQTKASYEALAEAQKQAINDQVEAEKAAAKQKRDQAVAAAANSRTFAQDRLRIEQEYQDAVAAAERSGGERRAQVVQQTTSAVTEAEQRAARATQEIQSRSPLGSIFDDLKESAKAGTLSIDDMTGAMGQLVAAGGPVGAVLAGIVGYIGSLKALADAQLEYANALDTTAKAGDFELDQAAGIIYSFERIGGSATDAQQMLSQFTTRVNEARGGSDDAIESFQRMGISLDDLEKLKAGELFQKIANGLLAVSDQEARVRGATSIFGDDDANKFLEIIGYLKTATKEAKEFGKTLSQKEIDEAQAYGKQINEISAHWNKLGIILGKEVIPQLTGVLELLNSIIQLDGEAFLAYQEEFEERFNRFTKSISDNVTTQQLYWASLRSEAGKTGQSLDAYAKQIQPAIQEISGALGSNYEKTVVFTRGNQATIESVRSNIEVFKQAAAAQKLSGDEVLRITQGNVEYAKALINQGQTQKVAVEVAKERKKAEDAVQESLNALTTQQTRFAKALADAESSEKLAIETAGLRVEALQLEEAEMRRMGATELTVAKASADAVRQASVIKSEAAVAYHAAQVKLIESTYRLEVKKAEGSKELIAKAESDKADALQKAENEYNAKNLKIRVENEAARSRIEKAAADERSKLRSDEFQKLADQARDEIDLITKKEEQGYIRHTTAAEERSRLRTTELAEQQRMIEQQLAAEYVGVEERKSLEEELNQVRRQLREVNRQGEAELNQAIIDDTRSRVAEQTAELGKQQAYLEQAVAIIEGSALSQIDKEMTLIELKQQSIALEIQKAQAELSAARSTGEAKEKIIELEIRLIGLQTQSIQLANQAGTAYKNAGLSNEEAAERAYQAQRSGIAAFISFVESLAGKAQGFTKETVAQGIEDLKALVVHYRETSLFLIASYDALFDWAATKAEQALIEAYKKQAEITREERAKREAERRAEAEKRASEEQAIRDRALEEERRANKQLADAREDYRTDVIEEDKRWLVERQKVIDDGNAAIARIESDREAARLRRKQEENERLLQLERDLADSRQEAALESSQRLADSEFDRVNREIAAQRALDEAKKGGDKDGQARAQSELDGIAAERDRASRRAAEEKTAREQATSDEQLGILLDEIEQKYQREEEYYNSVAALGSTATAEELARLKAAYDAQLKALEDTRTAELNSLQQREARAAQARADAAAAEEAEYQRQLDAQVQQNINLLSTAEQGHRDRLTKLKEAMAAEESAFAESMAKIRSNLEAELAKMTEAWGNYSKDANGALNSTSGGGSGGGGGNTAGGGGSGGGPSSSSGGGSGGGGSSVGGGGSEPPPSAPPPPPPPSEDDSGDDNNATHSASGTGNSLLICNLILEEFKSGKLTTEEALAKLKKKFENGKIGYNDYIRTASLIAALKIEQESDAGNITSNLTTTTETTRPDGDPGELTSTGPGRQPPEEPPAAPPATTPGAGTDSELPEGTVPGAKNANIAYTRIKIRTQDLRDNGAYQAMIGEINDALGKGWLDAAEAEDLKTWAKYYLKSNAGIEGSESGGIQITDPSQLGGGGPNTTFTPGSTPSRTGGIIPNYPVSEMKGFVSQGSEILARKLPGATEAVEKAKTENQTIFSQNTNVELKGDTFPELVEKLRPVAQRLGYTGA